MQAFFVTSEAADGLYGPYSRPIADRVLKIVRMASDETAELEVADFDTFGEQLQSGLLPFKVCVVVLQGKVLEPWMSRSAGHRPQRASLPSGRTTGSTLSGRSRRMRPKHGWQVYERSRHQANEDVGHGVKRSRMG